MKKQYYITTKFIVVTDFTTIFVVVGEKELHTKLEKPTQQFPIQIFKPSQANGCIYMITLGGEPFDNYGGIEL